MITRRGLFVISLCIAASWSSCDEQGGGMSNMRPVDTTKFDSVEGALLHPDRAITLEIVGDPSTTLPVQLTLLSKLQFLDWTEGNLTEIPSFIGDLQYMESMVFWNNAITKVAPEIGQLKNLITLGLKSNKLTRLPDEICNLNKLRFLSLDTNNISYLPDSIYMLSDLDVLRIQANPINKQEIERIRKALPNLKYFYHD